MKIPRRLALIVCLGTLSTGVIVLILTHGGHAYWKFTTRPRLGSGWSFQRHHHGTGFQHGRGIRRQPNGDIHEVTWYWQGDLMLKTRFEPDGSIQAQYLPVHRGSRTLQEKKSAPWQTAGGTLWVFEQLWIDWRRGR